MTDHDDSFLSDATATSPDDHLRVENNTNQPIAVSNNLSSSNLDGNANQDEADKYINIIQESPAFQTSDREGDQRNQSGSGDFLSKNSKTSFKKKISFKKIINDVSTLDYDNNFVTLTDIAKKYGNNKKKNKGRQKKNNSGNTTASKYGITNNPFTVNSDSSVQYFKKNETVDDRIIKKIQIYYDDENKFYEKDDQFYESLNSNKYTSTLIQLKNVINEIVQTEIQYLINLKILTESFLPFILDNNNTTLNMLTYYSNLLLKKHQVFIEEILGFFAEIEIMNFLQIDINNFKKLNLKIKGQDKWKSTEYEYYKMLKHFDYNNSSLNMDKNKKHKSVNDGSNLFFGYYLILDYLSLKTTDVVSTYLYENYIKIYYIMLRVLKNKDKSKINTKVCESIVNLNNLMSIRQKTSKLKKNHKGDSFFEDDNSPRDVFNNITFESLLQVPINRIMKYKIFMSKILTEYNVEDRCKINIAINFNDLLRKLEKIDNFQLDYVYTIKQSRYNKKEYKNMNISNEELKDAESYDPNERYSKIVDKIKYNHKDIVVNGKLNEGGKPLNLESFGSIILLQPCIVRYISNIHQSFFGYKENTNSQRIKYPTGLNNMGVYQESKVILLLFKSHLLLLKPSKLNKQYVLNVVFSLPLAICEIINDEQTLIENSNTSINVRIECNFLMYEIMITSWNDIEHENFSAKLKNLMKYYNQPVLENKDAMESQPKKNSVYQHGNDYNLSKESLLNNRSLKFNDINDMFKQFIYPKNIVICDYESEYFDDLEVCYNKKIFFIKNNYVINRAKYTDIEKNWIIKKKSESLQIADSDDNHELDVNFEDRVFMEKYLDQSNLWYNEIDILRLKDFEVSEAEYRASTKISKFLIKTRDHKRGSFRNKLKKSASFMSKSMSHGSLNDLFTNKSGSVTTTSDKSVMYLPSADILQSSKELRSSILKHNETSSYCNNGTLSGALLLKSGSVVAKEDPVASAASSKKKFYLSDETILNEQMVNCNQLIRKEECVSVEQSLKTHETSLSDVLDGYADDDEEDEENDQKSENEADTSGYLVSSIVKQGTRLLYKMFL